MTELSEFAKNRIRLLACQKRNTAYSAVYVGILLIFTVSNLLTLMFMLSFSPIFMVFDSIIFKALELGFGFFACYHHKTIYAYFTVIIQFMNTIMSFAFMRHFSEFDTYVVKDFNSNLTLLVIFIALVILVTKNNKEFLYLEQQPGYPYFDEKIEEQKFDRVQNAIKSEFQEKMEQYRKNAPTELPDLDFGRKVEIRETDRSQLGIMNDLEPPQFCDDMVDDRELMQESKPKTVSLTKPESKPEIKSEPKTDDSDENPFDAICDTFDDLEDL